MDARLESRSARRRRVVALAIAITLGHCPWSFSQTSPVVRAATRTLASKYDRYYDAGTTHPVVITLDRAASGPVTVIETVPPGWSVTNLNPPASVNATTITWSDATSETVQYTAVQGGPENAKRWPATFSGRIVDETGTSVPITGDSVLLPLRYTLFQQEVYPDTKYAGCTDSYISMFGGTGHVAGDRNQGAWEFLEEGDWFGIENPFHDNRAAPGFDDNRAILVKFDVLGEIPRNGTVTESWLRLYYVGQRRDLSSSPTVQPIAHRTWSHFVKRAWGEGAGGGPEGPAAGPGECSWLSARTGAEDWETSGCRGADDIMSPGLMVAQSSADYGTTEGVWVEYGIRGFVQSWVNDPLKNYGLKISQDDLGNSTSGYHFGVYDFASGEYPDLSLRPMLSVRWEAADS